MFVSLIATVFNEEASIRRLLESIVAQCRQPDEVVVVDGGSTDRTVETLNSYSDRLTLRVLVEPACNISRGRNLAIQAAKGDIVASTDAGVQLSPHWLYEIVKPFANQTDTENLHAVAGFFVADPQNTFEVAMGATVLPNCDEIDPAKFLPSSRSVAFTKQAWRQVGGYPEWLDYCEDLNFDFKLKAAGYTFTWAPRAIVYFRPRSNLSSFFRQYYLYARGDGKADLWAKRHAIRYASYIAGLAILVGGLWLPPLWVLLPAGLAVYICRPYRRLWATSKKMPIADKLLALSYVPLIRITGDIAKMIGYPVGVLWRLKRGRANQIGQGDLDSQTPQRG